MADTKSAASDQSLIRAYAVCHATKYFMKEWHKQNLDYIIVLEIL